MNTIRKIIMLSAIWAVQSVKPLDVEATTERAYLQLVEAAHYTDQGQTVRAAAAQKSAERLVQSVFPVGKLVPASGDCGFRKVAGTYGAKIAMTCLGEVYSFELQTYKQSQKVLATFEALPIGAEFTGTLKVRPYGLGWHSVHAAADWRDQSYIVIQAVLVEIKVPDDTQEETVTAAAAQ